MRKIFSLIFGFIGFAIVFSACSSETYTDKLNKEKKAINRYIDANNIKVLSTYPDKHKFAENEYFKDPSTGIYIHVIDSGNHEKPTKVPKTDIQLRYDSVYNMLENSVVLGPNLGGMYMQFTYGDATTYYYANSNASSVYQYQMYYFLSQACVIPLEHGLGNNAEVKLIVPFETGSTYQKYYYMPFYYSRLIYRFQVPVIEE